MVAKGKKRKAPAGDIIGQNGHVELSVPDRATWTGWVEMESEPAFFNVMLKEMGVRGVKVQEVYDLDSDYLAMLPRPVHALIFLFRYRETENPQCPPDGCPKHVWFANQTPDFACATFALLNIVNNIPDLELGEELRKFRRFTQSMDSLDRGDAVDNFDFVKRIHNSFARESDLLLTDMHLRNKVDRLKKHRAIAKARDTREAKKAAAKIPQTLGEQNFVIGDESVDAPRMSSRTHSPCRSHPDGPTVANGFQNGHRTRAKSGVARKVETTSVASNSSDEFEAKIKKGSPAKEQSYGLRRSARASKPRQDMTASLAETDAEEEEGFHFCAYMPIQGHLWKLDGLDRYPQDMGSFNADDGGDWMLLAQPALMERMAQYAASEIQFNIMAIVHDPHNADRIALAQNIKALQTVDKKLDSICEDWWSMEGAGTGKDVITDAALDLGISLADVAEAIVLPSLAEQISQEDDFLKLIELRQTIIGQQAGLRKEVRESIEVSKHDEVKAKHRRHDYGKFVDAWLGALAEHGMLGDLVTT